jgi:flagellar protein FliS
MTSEEIKNYTLRVSQANVSSLADILVDLSIDNLASSIEALENDDNALFVLHSKKAERCISELIHSLELEEPVAKTMAGYLIEAHKSVLNGRLRLDKSLILRAGDIMRTVKPTFARIASEDKDPSVMNNVEQVYAGLTYGKGGLNETSVGVSSNRGFTV